MVLSGRIICSKPGIYADGVQFCIFVFKKTQYIMKHLVAILFMLAAMPSLLFSQDFKLGESGYFNCKGVDAMLFNDYYPEGHQGGVSIIMHGKRVATNGDIRFDETPAVMRQDSTPCSILMCNLPTPSRLHPRAMALKWLWTWIHPSPQNS